MSDVEKNLEWNEEYAIRFVLNGHEFSTKNGNGYSFRCDAKDEVERLEKIGATSIKVFVRKWNYYV